MPCAAEASRSLRPGGGTCEPGGSQAAKTGSVWESGQRQLSRLHPQGLLCGRHTQCISGLSEERECSWHVLCLYCVGFGTQILTHLCNTVHTQTEESMKYSKYIL